MTSLFSNTMSPAKDGNSSLPRRSGSLGKPPLRALYDLLIAPMEGVSTPSMGHCPLMWLCGREKSVYAIEKHHTLNVFS